MYSFVFIGFVLWQVCILALLVNINFTVGNIGELGELTAIPQYFANQHFLIFPNPIIALALQYMDREF